MVRQGIGSGDLKPEIIRTGIFPIVADLVIENGLFVQNEVIYEVIIVYIGGAVFTTRPYGYCVNILLRGNIYPGFDPVIRAADPYVSQFDPAGPVCRAAESVVATFEREIFAIGSAEKNNGNRRRVGRIGKTDRELDPVRYSGQ